jgi:hypothetical protein
LHSRQLLRSCWPGPLAVGGEEADHHLCTLGNYFGLLKCDECARPCHRGRCVGWYPMCASPPFACMLSCRTLCESVANFTRKRFRDIYAGDNENKIFLVTPGKQFECSIRNETYRHSWTSTIWVLTSEAYNIHLPHCPCSSRECQWPPSCCPSYQCDMTRPHATSYHSAHNATLFIFIF